jgi:hypothetical protein
MLAMTHRRFSEGYPAELVDPDADFLVWQDESWSGCA